MADVVIAIPIKQWMARSTLKFFERQKDSLMIPGVVNLARNTVVKIMSRNFEVILRDCHYITIAARMILADRLTGDIYKEDEVFRAENEINAHFERVNDWLDRRIEQAEAKLRMAGFDPDKVDRKTLPYETKSTTRTATDYLQLLVKADIYLVLNEALWIAGELSDNSSEALRARLHNENEVQVQMRTVTRTTTKHFDILRKICAAVMDEREAARLRQSARDKKRFAKQKARTEAKAKQGEVRILTPDNSGLLREVQAEMNGLADVRKGNGKRKAPRAESAAAPISTEPDQPVASAA
jgi:hypothetical protein